MLRSLCPDDINVFLQVVDFFLFQQNFLLLRGLLFLFSKSGEGVEFEELTS